MMLYRYRAGKLVCLVLVLITLAARGMAEPRSEVADHEATATLVTAEWLSQHLDDPDLVVLDCSVSMVPKDGGGFRSVSGRADYEGGHIPTARFADLKQDLCAAGDPLDFALPAPERFCTAMGALGVGDDTRVVLYDRFHSVWAARVWWMLRWVGFDRAALLDGGLAAWTAAGRELTAEPADQQARRLTPEIRPGVIADRDEVFAAIDDPAVLLVDAMLAPHYHGKMTLYGRPGHIPGAINVPAMSLLDESGRFRPRDELTALFAGDRRARVITYCGAGVAASADAYVLWQLGYTDVAVYMASLQEWAADPANPLVVDEP
jgi:thiosulfate/3-mercaptopyruvate sulfurtransferase